MAYDFVYQLSELVYPVERQPYLCEEVSHPFDRKPNIQGIEGASVVALKDRDKSIEAMFRNAAIMRDDTDAIHVFVIVGNGNKRAEGGPLW